MRAATNGHSAGLCMTCNNSPDCGYKHRRGFDALWCDLFTDYTETCFPRAAAMRPSPVPSRPVQLVDQAGVPVRGLCMNCDNLASCSYPKPESGVWRCEEYR